MINRRLFALAGLSAFIAGRAAQAARLDEPIPEDWARRVFASTSRGSGIDAVSAMVTRYAVPTMADGRVRSSVAWNTNPEVISTYRDVSIVDVEQMSLPDEAGYLLLWTELEGSDAVETRCAGGFFSHDVYVWDIVVTGNDDDTMLALVEQLATDLPALDLLATPMAAEAAPNPLWPLLPTAADLPGAFRLVEEEDRWQTSSQAATPAPAP